jgi:ribosomal protein S18 acetylase RimI-like enzyme
VLHAQRSQGAGAALVRATAQRLRAAGLTTLRLGVVAGNEGAMRFYERLGAERTGREPADWAPTVMHEIYRWPDLSALD